MNYLTQIIGYADGTEIFDLKKKYVEVERKVNSLDEEIKNYLESNHDKFAMLPQENQLSIKAEEVTAEVDQLVNHLQTQVKRELESSIQQSETLSMKLNETNLSLSIVKRLLDIDNVMKAAKDNQNRCRYLEAAKKFKHLQEILASDEYLKNLSIYESLADRISFQHSEFLNVNLAIWNKFVILEEHPLSDNSKKVILTLNSGDGKSDVLRVLLYYDYLDYQVTLLGKKLNDRLLEPIMNYKKYKTNSRVYSKEGVVEIALEFKEVDSSISTCDRSVETLLDIFNTMFSSLNISIRQKETFINKLGESMELTFCDNFNKFYIYEKIPVRRKDLPEFEKILSKIKAFEAFLKENGFLEPENSTISDYIKNKDDLFIQKMCQAFLVNARQIMRRDLHDMVQITSSSEKEESKSASQDTSASICENFWKLPTCFISKSTQQLLTLIKNGLNEITSDNESHNNIKIFNTLRDTISMFLDITPLIHDDLLRSLPQQAALFYNNCMYLAHELNKLNVRVSNLLTGKIVTTFVDFVQPLQSEGCMVLEAQVQFQKQQLQEILEHCGLSILIEYTEFPPSVEKSVAQCLRQLSLLQSVWQNILPNSIYSKYIGILCDVFLENLIESVLELPDITVDNATQLTNIFTNIQNKVPFLFKDPKEIYRNVELWLKFSELIFILNGSLKDIGDRWADGKGPLAQEFSPDQLKHLIRALFQHTDRRSNLLSKIR